MNDTLVSLSLTMNKMSEIDILGVLDSSFNHPNLEILQLAEKIYVEEDGVKDPNYEKKKLMENKISRSQLYVSIEGLMKNNISIKKLEIRYMNLDRQLIQILFRGLQMNSCIQWLILSHDALKFGTNFEFELLRKTLSYNQGLKIIDF